MDLTEDPIVNDSSDDDIIISNNRKRKRGIKRTKRRLVFIEIELDNSETVCNNYNNILAPNSNTTLSPVSLKHSFLDKKEGLIFGWFGAVVPLELVEEAKEHLDKIVTHMGFCFVYYGYATIPSLSREDMTLRLLILAKRIVDSMGGRISVDKFQSMMNCCALLLVKMWSDTTIHIKLLELLQCDAKEITILETVYLKNIKFRCHISQSDVLEFNTFLNLTF